MRTMKAGAIWTVLLATALLALPRLGLAESSTPNCSEPRSQAEATFCGNEVWKGEKQAVASRAATGELANVAASSDGQVKSADQSAQSAPPQNPEQFDDQNTGGTGSGPGSLGHSRTSNDLTPGPATEAVSEKAKGALAVDTNSPSDAARIEAVAFMLFLAFLAAGFCWLGTIVFLRTARYSIERFSYPIFKNWNLLLWLIGLPALVLAIMLSAQDSPLGSKIPAILVLALPSAVALFRNIRRTNLPFGIWVSIIQIPASLLSVFLALRLFIMFAPKSQNQHSRPV